MTTPIQPKTGSDDSHRFSTLILALAILSAVLQLWWFGTKCLNQIDIDGMTYVGIARHIRQGEFYAAINAFRSPLDSWLIAAASFASTDYLLIGKLVSVASFLLCLALLYTFAFRLWHSRLVASVAVLLFTLGRGLAVQAIAMVTPDFLLAALVLGYFIVLLDCARTDRSKDWLLLGGFHGLAFLAKAFALPWLGLCTAVAVLLSDSSWKRKAGRFCLAMCIPVIVAAGWATVLHSKYGVYTTGSQFKTNLLQWTLGERSVFLEKTYGLLRDTSKQLDDYAVGDSMPPGSRAWAYHVDMKEALPKLLLAEKGNVPKALKELTIVTTPGALLAFLATVVIFTRRRLVYPVEWRLTAVIVASAIALILAYCMLVFDERYLFPLIPLVLVVGARFLVADAKWNYGGLRTVSIALVILGVVASLVYSSSPFRDLTRNFQAASYEAGGFLRNHTASATLVSIGIGPYPEHGVGWEAGYHAAYFGGQRLVATMDSLPSSTQMQTLAADLEKASSGAIVVWGRPSDSRYVELVLKLVSQHPYNRVERIADPVVGEVGAIVFTGG